VLDDEFKSIKYAKIINYMRMKDKQTTFFDDKTNPPEKIDQLDKIPISLSNT
jgi:hypothetical protein